MESVHLYLRQVYLYLERKKEKRKKERKKEREKYWEKR